VGEILSANRIEGVVRRNVPERVISRLPIYLQAVETIVATGRETVSSEDLAAASGVSPSILRKDLSQLGRSGKRGVGYSCPELVTTLRGFLGLDRDRSVAIIGAGRLGSALADYAGFRRRGLRLTAIFDIDEQKIGDDDRHADRLRSRRPARLERAHRPRGHGRSRSRGTRGGPHGRRGGCARHSQFLTYRARHPGHRPCPPSRSGQ
jgi:hypothetical protein